jgi:hypothetical protein
LLRLGLILDWEKGGSNSPRGNGGILQLLPPDHIDFEAGSHQILLEKRRWKAEEEMESGSIRIIVLMRFSV